MFTLFLLAAGFGGFSPSNFILLLIPVIFYFFMIRPQSKKMKEQKAFIEKLQKGDRVVTVSGIHGKIVDVDPAYYMLEVDREVRIKFDRSAISHEMTTALNKSKTEAEAK